jgi:two-component system, chemotaxis family, chemotaxis protein CheY
VTTRPWVLVVDDDPDVREAVSDVLESSGCDVSTAMNGRDALGSLRSALARVPDLILLDIMMPVMDGWEFLEQLERMAELDPVPVLVFTAHADAGQACARGRVAGYLPKPPSLEALVRAVALHARHSPPGAPPRPAADR